MHAPYRAWSILLPFYVIDAESPSTAEFITSILSLVKTFSSARNRNDRGLVDQLPLPPEPEGLSVVPAFPPALPYGHPDDKITSLNETRPKWLKQVPTVDSSVRCPYLCLLFSSKVLRKR